MHLVRMLFGCLLLTSAPDVHLDGLRGFRLEFPDGWTVQEQTSGSETGYRLTVRAPAEQPGVAFRLEIARSEGSARSALERDRSRFEADASFSDLAETDTRAADRDAPTLCASYRAGSETWRIRRTYLLERDSTWILHRNAPIDRLDELDGALADIVASFAFVELSEQGRHDRRLAELADRCGSEVRWAADWEEAARRSRAEGRPILVVAWLLATFTGASDARHGLFMDPDVIELVNERFVPLWYRRGMQGPFVDRYGMGPTAFGKALIAVTAEGEVLFETHELDRASVAHAFLRRRLSEHPELAGKPLPPGLDGVERARRCVARGELDQALEALDGISTGSAHLLRARIHRLERRGEEALAALEQAREAGGVEPATLLLEQARVLLRLQRDGEARVALESVLALGDSAQATFLLATLDLRRGDGASATRRWQALVAEVPDSRFAWQAAQALRTSAGGAGWRPDLRWPREDALAEVLAPRVRTPVPTPDAQQALSTALAWLVASQRADGSWVSPTEVAPGSDASPEPFVDSITALAGRALLEHLDIPEVEAAARQALAFVRSSVERRERTPPFTYVMDYTTWSDACMLHFLADAADAGLCEADALQPSVTALLADLRGRQQAGGGWSYLVTGTPESGRPPSHSMSFVTATVVLALVRASEVGFEVPGDLLAPAVDCLERMRNDDGAFEYRLVHGREDAPRNTPVPGAAGRAPLCELALSRAGRGSDERLRSALDLLLEHATIYEAETGKALAHAGPYIVGCHYLLFDYVHAAQALGGLEPDPRTRTRLTELVLACRLADGSFIDNPVVGRSYATAMAVVALSELAPG